MTACSTSGDKSPITVPQFISCSSQQRVRVIGEALGENTPYLNVSTWPWLTTHTPMINLTASSLTHFWRRFRFKYLKPDLWDCESEICWRAWPAVSVSNFSTECFFGVGGYQRSCILLTELMLAETTAVYFNIRGAATVQSDNCTPVVATRRWLEAHFVKFSITVLLHVKLSIEVGSAGS